MKKILDGIRVVEMGFYAVAVTPGATPTVGLDAGSALGKRYASESGELELLVTKAGSGSLSIGDKPLGLKDAKKLPSSD